MFLELVHFDAVCGLQEMTGGSDVRVYNWRVVIGSFILMALASGAWSQEGDGLPQVKGRITDEAQIISPSQQHLLYQILAQHEFASHQQVVVLTVEGKGIASIEDYATRIWQAWASQKKSTSVLLVLFKEQKSAAIVAGDEPGKRLDKASISQIIDGVLATNLQRGDFDNAAMEGVKAIVGKLTG
jgi:uncharacterized protein